MGYAQDMATEKYPVGTLIQMLESHDPEGTIPQYTTGIVIGITETGLLRVRWHDSGRVSSVDITRDGVTDA